MGIPSGNPTWHWKIMENPPFKVMFFLSTPSFLRDFQLPSLILHRHQVFPLLMVKNHVKSVKSSGKNHSRSSRSQFVDASIPWNLMNYILLTPKTHHWIPENPMKSRILLEVSWDYQLPCFPSRRKKFWTRRSLSGRGWSTTIIFWLPRSIIKWTTTRWCPIVS